MTAQLKTGPTRQGRTVTNQSEDLPAGPGGHLFFLDDGGELGALIRAHPWAQSPLGSPETWPVSLTTLVAVMLGSAQPMFVAWGPECVLLYNDAYVALLGNKHPAALGRQTADVFAEAWHDIGPLFERVFDGESVHMDDLTLMLERGGAAKEAHFSFSYTPVRNSGGRVSGLFCAATETTAKVLYDRSHSAERERQRLLLQQMPGFVGVLYGPTHIYEYVNDAYLALTGKRDFIGRTVRDVLPELKGQGFYELLDRVFATGEPYVAHAVPVRLEGESIDRFIDFLYAPTRDDDGNVTGIFVGGYDVSAAERATASLRELNADLERQVAERARERSLTWQVSPDLLGALNSKGYFETSNPAWQSVLGWSESEVARMSIFEMLHPDDVGRTRVELGLAQTGRPAIGFPNRMRARNGAFRWISWVGVLEEGMVYCSGRDITAEKEKAEALEFAEEALRQAQKMEAVGQLTGGLAHDFNNLLTVVSGNLDMIEGRLGQGRVNDLERYINAAHAATKRAAALTHRLLAFSRRQTLAPKATDVNRLVLGMEELVRRTMGPAITMDAPVSAAGLWSTQVDPGQLENALLNLCINARDAMPDGGTLTIETGNRWLDERAGRERGLPAGQYISLCVSDTGTGMPADVVARAFDPFFTTKPIGMGTGLGLSMIYGFAQQSGGQVRIYSEVGAGTMVCIYLPRFTGTSEEEDTSSLGTSVTSSSSSGTVLVVDDEPEVRALVIEVLEDLGYTVLQAGNGTEALNVLKTDAHVDLLVTDVGLPGMNGRQVADAARAHRPGLTVLFITGYAENAVLSHGHLDPGMHVLTKPFAVQALASRVESLMVEAIRGSSPG
jgi:PAS domain S-box-containing protein